MAGANLLKKPADWSSLAAGVEVNPDGSGFRLTRLTDFFDFTTDEGITWEDDGTGESWENNTGTLRSANGFIELVAADQGEETHAYKAGFSVTGDFLFDFNFKVTSGSGFWMVGLANTSDFPRPSLGDGTTNSLSVGISGTSDVRAESFKLGVRTSGDVDGISGSITLYGRLERSGSTFTAKIYSGKGQSGLLSTSTVNNVSTATLDHIIFITSFGPGSSSQSNFGTFREMELWNGITQRYTSTSPVATMGVVALPVGTIINGLGDLIEKLDGSAGISPEYNINDAGWVGPFATYAAMDAALNATPIEITDDTLSVNVRHSHDSDGSEQAEVFVSEGPNLTSVGGGQETFTGGMQL